MVCECHSISDPIILNIWACLHHYNYRDARFAAERVFAENPCDESLYLLATCLYRNNLPKQAKLLLLRHDVNSPKCKYLLAKCHMDTGNNFEAETTLLGLNQELKTPSDVVMHYKEIAPFVLIILAEIFKLSDRKKLAVNYLKKCLELNPLLWSAYEDLIDMHENVEPNEVFNLPKGAILTSGSCLKALSNRINIGEIYHPNCPSRKRSDLHDSQEDLSMSRENVNPKFDQKTFESMETDEFHSSLESAYSGRSSSRLDSGSVAEPSGPSPDYSNQNRQIIFAPKSPNRDEEQTQSVLDRKIKPLFGNSYQPISSMYACVPVFNSRISESTEMVHFNQYNSPILGQNSINTTKKVRVSNSGTKKPPFNSIRRSETSTPIGGLKPERIPNIGVSPTRYSKDGLIFTHHHHHHHHHHQTLAPPSTQPTNQCCSPQVCFSEIANPALLEQQSTSSSGGTTNIRYGSALKLQKPGSSSPSVMSTEAADNILMSTSPITEDMASASSGLSRLHTGIVQPATKYYHHQQQQSSSNTPRTRLQVAKAAAAQQRISQSKKNLLKSCPKEEDWPQPQTTDLSCSPAIVGGGQPGTGSSTDPRQLQAGSGTLPPDTSPGSSDSGAVDNFLRLMVTLGRAYKLLRFYKCHDALAEIKKLPKHHLETALVLWWKAKAQFELNERLQARDTLLFSRSMEAWQLYGVVMYSSILWKLNKESTLLTLANEMIEFDRESPDIWCVYGNCMSLIRDSDTAIRFFQRSIQINPKYVYGYILLGHEYYYDDEMDRALICFRRALEQDVHDYTAMYGIAMIYQRQENYQEASKFLKEALRIHPDSCYLLTNLAVIRSRLKQYKFTEGALELLDKACRLFPKDPLCRFHKASVLFQVGRYQEALADLKQLLAVAPEAKVFLLMSLIYKQLGDTGLAMMYSSKATELDPKCNNESFLLDRSFCQQTTTAAVVASGSVPNSSDPETPQYTPMVGSGIMSSNSGAISSLLSRTVESTPSPGPQQASSSTNSFLVMSSSTSVSDNHHQQHHRRRNSDSIHEDISSVNQLSFDFLESD